MQPRSQPAFTAQAAVAPRSSWLHLTAFDVQFYRTCDALTELLLYAAIIFSPWAFGTTQPWSIWTMNSLGYSLGILLAGKIGIRRLKGYRPARWENANSVQLAQDVDGLPTRQSDFAPRRAARLTRALAVLTFVLLAYCLTSAVNASSSFDDKTLSFQYRSCVRWLPHSYDSVGSWLAFWRYLALACAFWAIRDWLLGKGGDATEQCRWPIHATTHGPFTAPLPARLSRLVGVLVVNGFLLGFEGIVQRLDGGGRLLFLVQPRIHHTAAEQFGPYAYRANAAQYFNLLWPMCLALWWRLRQTQASQAKRAPWLLVCACVLLACPACTGSRAGAALAACQAIAVIGVLCLKGFSRNCKSSSAERRSGGWQLAVSVGSALLLGTVLGWPVLGPRFTELAEGLRGREALYAAARPMLTDFPVFGTGPGTFETVSYLYPRPDLFWPPQLHNDWLQTRITFGAVGSLVLALFLVTILSRRFVSDGIPTGREFTLLIWVALAGCLAHARYDFPFQVYSVQFVFVLLCAILFVSSKSGRAATSG